MFKLIKVKLLYLRSDFITLKSVEELAALPNCYLNVFLIPDLLTEDQLKQRALYLKEVLKVFLPCWLI